MAATENHTPKYITTIKNFCVKLSGTGFDKITVEYDSSGDSGDMYILFEKPAQIPIGMPPNDQNNQNNKIRLDFDDAAKELLKAKNTLFTSAVIDEFYDALYEVMPMGWEINEGSFGTIHIAVETGKITLEHNERIVEIHSETHTF